MYAVIGVDLSLEGLNHYWPFRIAFALAAIAFFGWYFYYVIGHIVVGAYIGDGDWKRGLLKFGVAVAAGLFTVKLLQMFAFMLWEGLPLANQYEDTAARYHDACQITYQTDENSSETDTDWHDGPGVCAPLYRHVRQLYPRPSWLFGRPPSE